MEKSYINLKGSAEFNLVIGCLNDRILNKNGSFLKFIWNSSIKPCFVSIDGITVELGGWEVLCVTYLQTISIIGNYDSLVLLMFNREFYCVHTNDSEVSCNGILFFGTNQTPVFKINDKEFELVSYLLKVLEEEFDIKDQSQEEMLRILLKRFIILCTRLAKKQIFFTDPSPVEVDLIRHFNVLVEENYKTLKKVSDYANLMHKSPKTITNLFGKFSDLSPLEIIHNRIIIEAEKLFNYTNKSAKEIGLELGFEDPAQFSKFFKSAKGVSIRDYRK